jgi:hypothetical protein
MLTGQSAYYRAPVNLLEKGDASIFTDRQLHASPLFSPFVF